LTLKAAMLGPRLGLGRLLRGNDDVDDDMTSRQNDRIDRIKTCRHDNNHNIFLFD